MIAGALSPAQLTAARQLLGWSRTALASRISSSFDAVKAFEVDGRILIGFNPARARAAFEAAGIEFTVENGGASVRLRKPQPSAIPLEHSNLSNDE